MASRGNCQQLSPRSETCRGLNRIRFVFLRWNPAGGHGDDRRHDHDHVIRVGEYLDPAYYGDRYVLVRDPGRYGLDPYGTYYRIDGNVFQVNRETQEVLALIGAVSAILN